jgi:hypothetical protein
VDLPRGLEKPVLVLLDHRTVRVTPLRRAGFVDLLLFVEAASSRTRGSYLHGNRDIHLADRSGKSGPDRWASRRTHP